jgi:hypothetical protein
MTDYPLARRTLITRASLSIGAGLASAIAALQVAATASLPSPSGNSWDSTGSVEAKRALTSRPRRDTT